MFVLFSLTCDEVAKSNSSEGYEAVVDGNFVGPAFVKRHYDRGQDDEEGKSGNQVQDYLSDQSQGRQSVLHFYCFPSIVQFYELEEEDEVF